MQRTTKKRGTRVATFNHPAPLDPPSTPENMNFSSASFFIRQRTEGLLRYNLYVDCMPGDGLQEMDQKCLKRIMRVARSMVTLKATIMDKYANALSKEVCLEFTRAMGRILFDKAVEFRPEAFPFLTLPEPLMVEVKEIGETRMRGENERVGREGEGGREGWMGDWCNK